MHSVRSATASLFLSYLLLFSQARSGPPIQAFEVASIRPHDPALPGPTIMIPARGEVSISGMTVRSLIRFAYSVQDYQLAGGPKWIDSDKYDIRAKAAEQTERISNPSQTMDDQRVRIQLLLAERFALKLHHEPRQMPVYFLTVAKTGLKMSAVVGAGKTADSGSILPWMLFVTDLSVRVGRPVVDKTKLTGTFHVNLRYSDIDGKPDGVGVRLDQLDQNDPGPSLFTAIQEQMGLRLDSGKAPIDVVVIDSVSRPSSN